MVFNALLLALVVGATGDAGRPLDAGITSDAGVKVSLAPDVKALVDRVQAFYEKTQDFTADFKQEYTYKAFKRTQTSSGKVTFSKPALMRWEYEEPTPKTFVLAKDRVLAFDPEAKLLTRAALNTNQLSASVTFLFGVGKLESEFSIVKKACAGCRGTALEMTPLVPDPRFKKIVLEVDEKTAQVLKSTVFDPDGSENAITFIGLKTNVGINESHFKVSPPPGTQVQDFLGSQPSVGGKDGGVGALKP
jgi:outer membrane lipoprotein carrier protein